MSWILSFGRLLSPAGLVVPLLYSLSVIDWFFLLRCLLILYSIESYFSFYLRESNYAEETRPQRNVQRERGRGEGAKGTGSQ